MTREDGDCGDKVLWPPEVDRVDLAEPGKGTGAAADPVRGDRAVEEEAIIDAPNVVPWGGPAGARIETVSELEGNIYHENSLDTSQSPKHNFNPCHTHH
jgi:hypothetical protein